jgi:hypothetical protein
MKMQEAILIFKIMESHGENGIALAPLMLETRLDNRVLREYINKHPDFFVNVALSPNYAINPHGKFSGNVVKMLDTLEVNNKKVERQKNIGLVFMVVPILYVLPDLIAGFQNLFNFVVGN